MVMTKMKMFSLDSTLHLENSLKHPNSVLITYHFMEYLIHISDRIKHDAKITF